MSSVRHLYKIAVDLNVACQEHDAYLNVYHISGDRMITTGLDGWSCGDLDDRVLLGHNICRYLPLDRGAFDLSRAPLEEWCKGWMGGIYPKPLEPVGWF